jgi:hypothetical protein
MSEAVMTTNTLEEATEAGFLGVSFDDGDYTVSGVTKGEAKPAPAPTPPPAKADTGEKSDPAPSHRPRRGE